tara:strand:- start:353 stop:598 length:246 start_codon:yes stop_codon:yes gene_type:complete
MTSKSTMISRTIKPRNDEYAAFELVNDAGDTVGVLAQMTGRLWRFRGDVMPEGLLAIHNRRGWSSYSTAYRALRDWVGSAA